MRGEGGTYNRKFMVCCLRFWNVRNCPGCRHGNMVAEGGAGGGALIPPRAGGQVNEGYANFKVVQRSAVDILFKCPDKICNRF